MDVKRGLVSIRNPAKKGEAPKEFTFDGVYDWKLVYESNLYFLFFSSLTRVDQIYVSLISLIVTKSQ